MQPARRRALRLSALLAAVPAPAWASTHDVPGLAWGLPFLGVLLSIALMPIIAPRLWTRRIGLFSLAWALALMLPQALATGPLFALSAAWHVLVVDYLPFISLLIAIYAVGGGILLQGGPWGTPLGNTALMALATLLAGLLGPIAVSMVLIHPLLRANAHRTRKIHLVVFFIVLVCNVGGATTALGNPPLYIGLLQGVPFFWPASQVWKIVLVLAIPLLTVFWWLDYRSAALSPPPPPRRPLHMRGWLNIALLAVLVATVLIQTVWHPGDISILGADIALERLAGAIVFALVAIVAATSTPLAVHQGNMFSWEPMVEVAKLFAAIFVTITPAIAMLAAGFDGPLGPLLRLTADAAGHPRPIAYFWFSGILSAFLDNAPTYLLFFQLAGGDAVQLTGPLAPTLMALSAGSVCFGALTYIGNAPNMMVRGVAAHRGVHMPGFFGYMAWACALLLPGFALVTAIWFL